MHVDPEDVRMMDNKYGPARRIRFEPLRMLEWEYGLLKSSGRNGRQHDVTMFIEKSGDPGKYVCIQKPFYKNTGIYRAPSGGVERGESLEEGLKREMLEETGLEVVIDSFPVITETEFISPDGTEEAPWVSYVFMGHDVGGTIQTRDPREIFDIKLITMDELLGTVAKNMEESGWGGFMYRVKLTREVFQST